MLEDDEDLGWYGGGSKARDTRQGRLATASVAFSVGQETDATTSELFAKGSGSVVWEAADALLRWLDESYAPSGGLAGRTIVELGAGTGVCGLACALLGSSPVALQVIASLRPRLGSRLQAHVAPRSIRRLGRGDRPVRLARRRGVLDGNRDDLSSEWGGAHVSMETQVTFTLYVTHSTLHSSVTRYKLH